LSAGAEAQMMARLGSIAVKTQAGKDSHVRSYVLVYRSDRRMVRTRPQTQTLW
jgi:hypothetical protein